MVVVGGSAREKNDFNSASLRLLVPLLLHLQDIMNSEKSYDSLPNFTAADCEFAVVLLVFFFFQLYFNFYY